MEEQEIIITKLKCLRCKHEWIPNSQEKPRLCPLCHSPYWDLPRKIRSNRILAKIKNDKKNKVINSAFGSMPNLHSFKREEDKFR